MTDYNTSEVVRRNPTLFDRAERILSAATGKIEIYFSRFDESSDPFYLLAIGRRKAPPLLVKVAYTGDLERIGLIHNGESSQVLQRDRRFVYQITAEHVFKVTGEVAESADGALASLVGYVAYVVGREFRSDTNGFRLLSYNQLKARFDLLQRSQSSTDIVPTQTPGTIVVKASDGCRYFCNYCPERATVKQLSVLDRSTYEMNLQRARKGLETILGEEGLTRTSTLFLNTADILFLEGEKNVTSTEALELALQYFPWVITIDSFVGSETTLNASADPTGPFELNGERYSSARMATLQRAAQGKLKLKLGLETAHTSGSFLLGKPITYEQKEVAGKIIKGAGIPFEVILQLGVLGRNFSKQGQRFTSHGALEETIRWLNVVEPDRVHVSVFQEYGDLPILRLRSPASRRNQSWIEPYTSKEGDAIRQEMEFLMSNLREHLRDRVVSGYEEVLPRMGEKEIAYFS